MANMVDYLKWRGDIDLSVDPFNEVDNLILSELAYTDFEDIVPGPEVKKWISIKDVQKQFFEKYSEEEIMAKGSTTKVAPFLMNEMIKSRRFANLKLSGYVNEIDSHTQSQFSVVTFLLGDGTYYVAYRGTDNTIVGWKEDFNMGFLYQTAGQIAAMEYLNKNFKRTIRKIRVGGHSKGGNFAVFAASFANASVQNKIIEVYSNDGPGFHKKVLLSNGYNNILNRVHSTIPEQSIVGMLLENDMKHRVVLSSNSGAYQHDAMSWEILGNHFVTAENITEGSVKLDQTLKNWIFGLDNDVREEFVDVLFELIGATGASTFDQLFAAKWKTLSEMTKALNELTPEKQMAFRDVMKRLVVSGGETLKQTVKEKMPSKKTGMISKED